MLWLRAGDARFDYRQRQDCACICEGPAPYSISTRGWSGRGVNVAIQVQVLPRLTTTVATAVPLCRGQVLQFSKLMQHFVSPNMQNQPHLHANAALPFLIRHNLLPVSSATQIFNYVYWFRSSNISKWLQEITTKQRDNTKRISTLENIIKASIYGRSSL
jgi:hypothetical protein